MAINLIELNNNVHNNFDIMVCVLVCYIRTCLAA